MTTLSLIAYIGLITLAPLVLGAIILVLGAVHRATRPVVLALSILGALIPAVGLLYFIPAVAFGDPIAIQPFGLGSGFSAWIAPTYRLDAFALYTAIGVAFLVVPLLLWMAFADRADETALDEGQDEIPAEEDAGSAAADHSAGEVGAAHDANSTDAEHETEEQEEAGTDGESAMIGSGATRAWEVPASARGLAAPTLVRSVAFALALEMLALTAALADSVVLLGVSWVLLALAAWAIGESASDREHLDLLSLGVMVAGPILWLIVVLFPASKAHTPRLFSLNGALAFNTFECIVLAIAIALAGGAYPFSAWVRRRAALATPAGVGAVVVGVAPAALYVALRTYGVAVNATNQWPLFAAAPSTPTTPAPVTAGIAFALVGAATVAISGLLALARRDPRALVGLVATAQLGWGLVGVGIGVPISVLGTVLLLPAMVLGLGAMLATLVANGVITSDLEPDADGPRPAGEPLRPVMFAAWGVGALSVVGMPLLAGFAPRHLMDMGAIEISGLGIPLLGLCWAGDVLLALALLRAAAPALSTPTDGSLASGFAYGPRDIPAALLAVLALAIGIFPALLTGVFGNVAGAAILGPVASKDLAASSALGYTTGSAQWLSAIAWLVVGVVAVALVVARMSVTRTASAVFASGQRAVGNVAEAEAESDASNEIPAPLPVETNAAESAPALAEDAEPVATLAEPGDAWSDLKSTLESPWLLPAGGWLLSGMDDDTEDEEERAETTEGQDEPTDAQDMPDEQDEDESAADQDQSTHVSAKKGKRGEAPRDAE